MSRVSGMTRVTTSTGRVPRCFLPPITPWAPAAWEWITWFCAA